MMEIEITYLRSLQTYKQTNKHHPINFFYRF